MQHSTTRHPLFSPFPLPSPLTKGNAPCVTAITIWNPPPPPFKLLAPNPPPPPPPTHTHKRDKKTKGRKKASRNVCQPGVHTAHLPNNEVELAAGIYYLNHRNCSWKINEHSPFCHSAGCSASGRTVPPLPPPRPVPYPTPETPTHTRPPTLPLSFG